MIRPPFDGLPLAATLALVAFSLGAGVGMGWLYFRSVRATARLLAEGGRRAWALGLGVVRFTLLALGLVALSRAGALPLLAATAGILVARGLVLRAVEREVPCDS